LLRSSARSESVVWQPEVVAVATTINARAREVILLEVLSIIVCPPAHG
jgi:hypothetical protein